MLIHARHRTDEKLEANILDAGRSLFAALDLSAFTLPAEALAHVPIRITAAGR